MALENPGDTDEYQGSGSTPYKLKNHDGRIFSCSCPSWRNSRGDVHQKTCKHLKAVRGAAVEMARVGSSVASPAPTVVGPVSVTKAAPMATSDPALTVQSEEARLGRKLRPDEKTKLNGPKLLLANAFEDEKGLNPTGYFLSEKLDGIRAYWTGKEFLSRQGNVFGAPDWFISGLPSHPLDGELWLGRRKFQKTISVVKSGPSLDWKDVVYFVFDAPHLNLPFEERMEFLQNLCNSSKNIYLKMVNQIKIVSPEHLESEFRALVSQGAEGVMLRQPGMKYVPGRNSTILKMKPWKDSEARVIGHTAGKNANKGLLGALVVEMPNGKRFNVGSGLTAENRRNPPPIGCRITYKFMDTTDDGIPKGASFVSVRDYEG